MSQMHECPADGCEYTGVKSSVLGHYSGKQDEAHSGGYADAKRALSEGGQQESTESTDGGSTEGGAATPSFPAADGGSDGDEEVSCPECNSTEEVYEADSVLSLYERHAHVTVTPEVRRNLRDADAGCVGCGTAFTVGGDD